MIHLKVTIQTSIIPDDYEEHFGKNFKNIVAELLPLSGEINILFDKKIISPLFISYSKKPCPLIKKHLKQKKSRPYFHFLEFQTQLTISIKELEQKKSIFLSFDYYAKCFVRHLLMLTLGCDSK